MVVEGLNNHFEVTEVKLNHKQKGIRLVSQKKVSSLNDLKRPILPFDKLIFGLSSRQATTIKSLVNLKRAEPEEPITENELDGLVFKGLWNFLNHYRSWTAKKMGINELDVVLANIAVTDVQLGGHRVFNPIGFRSRDFVLSFEGTFVPRSLSAVLERFENWAKNLTVVEGPATLPSLIPEKHDFVVQASAVTTNVFISREEERLFFREFDWGSGHILKNLAQGFGVDEEVAELIWAKYSQGEISDHFKRLIEHHFREGFKVFFGVLNPLFLKFGLTERPEAQFYFRFQAPIIDNLFSESRFELTDLHENLIREGYNIRGSANFPKFSPRTYQHILAFLFYSPEHPQYDFLNQLLRRRAKWLISNSQISK